VEAHPNVFIFDFFNIVAEANPTQEDDEVNCLKYEYEVDHDGNEGHPNKSANLIAGEAFVNFIIEVFSGQEHTGIYYNENDPLSFHLVQNQLVVNSTNNCKLMVSIFGMDGRFYKNISLNGNTNYVDISTISNGF
jgi:hypothetical protein